MRLHSRKSFTSRPALLKAIQRSAEAKLNQLVALPFISANQITLSGVELIELAKGRSATSLENKNQPLLVLFTNQLIGFSPKNKYLIYPEQLWLIESVIGTQAFRQALSTEKKQTINDQFIEDLFAKAPFAFYLSADEVYLLSSDDELTHLDFGPLIKVSALDALQRFGLMTLERAKEKTAVRL